MNNIHLIENSLVKKELTILRNKWTDQINFNLAMKRISTIMAVETFSELKLKEIEIETPLEITTGHTYDQNIVLIPILRAGIGMVNSFWEMIPEAKLGYIGIQRNEITLEPVVYYYKVPPNLESASVILLDPMLATGGSCSAALRYLKQNGVTECSFVSLVASPQGIEKINNDHPEVRIFTGAIDRTLNDRGYILPGLGDAGDRTFGTL